MTACLVTGGAGFIGSHLVEALVAEGHAVRVLDDLRTGSLSNLAAVRDQIELITADLDDLDTVRQAMQDVELVFHQADLPSVQRSIVDPLATHQACASGTLQVLVAAREARVRRVLYGASGSAYGDAEPLPRTEGEPLVPLSPYAVAKVAGEHYCAAFTSVYGLETVRLRYFNVYGPRQPVEGPYAAVIPVLLDTMLGGKRPVLHGDGRQARDFTYVDDIVQANLLAAEARRVSGRVYNIGCGRATSLLELVDRINKLLGTSLRSIHTPPRPGDLRHNQADISRAQAELGYLPCTDLDTGLRRCLAAHAACRPGPKHLRRPACPVS